MQLTASVSDIGLAEDLPDADAKSRSTDVVSGSSAAAKLLREQLSRLAPLRCSVLITGETGTGKGVAARALHAASPWAASPFVHVDCAALAPSLLESELFGHERGAFTGAVARRRGRFDLSAAGTLFLDEIGELEPRLQAKLLRVLQDLRYERLGGTETLPLRARVLAATNLDLPSSVAGGRFRADLYYRLAVVELRMPALRDRKGDIGELFEDAWRARGAAGSATPVITSAAMEILQSHGWPGNVRELHNVAERLAIWGTGQRISGSMLRSVLGPSPDAAATTPPPPDTAAGSDRRLEEVLADCGGNIARAARDLGLPRSTLRYRLARLRSLERPRQLPLPGFGPGEGQASRSGSSCRRPAT